MTSNELRAKYNTAYRIIWRERKMREQVFREGDPRREEKLREMDRLLEIVTALKDELKQRMVETEQPRLLDVPRRSQYG